MARKILLADDSVTAQNMGRKILADAGYEVITVNNGSAALKKVGEHKPDLIVLDVYMPGYSGLEVCQRLKEAGDTSRIPILLTVGKLEPFKPEEARRVRADGFIIKPFEASELLSALSKLEDKVVPRSEPSKPGRFARATAAIDEGRFDRSGAVDEDSGWKSRIVFPKKKEKEPEQDVDDPAIYNPVNKDLRTVIEHKPSEHKAEEYPTVAPPQAEDERVNLSALAGDALPKDVTPEEIAALAAAAAQVKGKIAEPKGAEEKSSETIQGTPAVVAAETFTPSAVTKYEGGTPTEVATSAAAIQPAEAAQNPIPDEPSKGLSTTPIAAELPAVSAGLEQEGAQESNDPSRDSLSGASTAEEPATMAVAAAAGANGTRWTAVAVALSSEEASISLEQEMQKSGGSFAVMGEPEHSAASSVTSEAIPASLSVNEVVQESKAPFVEASAASAPAPEPAGHPNGWSDAGKSAEAYPAPTGDDNTVSAAGVGAERREEVSPLPIEQTTTSAAPEISAEPSVNSEETSVSGSPKELVTSRETKSTDSEAVGTAQESSQEGSSSVPAPEMQVATPEVDKAVAEKVESETASKEEAPDDVLVSSAGNTPAGTGDHVAKHDSDISANTAAAWASWRKIRDTGSIRTRETEDDGPELADDAAKAVAAGAEGNAEEVASLDSDPEIANIVDSVLADMRPRIVEEIAKKLGKKK